MNKLLVTFLLGAGLCATSHAAEPASSDGIAASFAHILQEETQLPAPPPPDATQADPLQQIMNDFLREMSADDCGHARQHALAATAPATRN